MRPGNEPRGTSTALVRYVTFDTEIGRFLVARGDAGLCHVAFRKGLDPEEELAHLTRRPHVLAVEDRIGLSRVVDDVRRYLAGEKVSFDYSMDLGGVTDFNRRVLETVREIPYGVLRSYQWVAKQIGSPRATRPVGQALARNPLPIVIPCHRVVNSDGTLGGYSGGGPDMKRRLIGLEAGQTGFRLGATEVEVRRRVRFLLETDPTTHSEGT